MDHTAVLKRLLPVSILQRPVSLQVVFLVCSLATLFLLCSRVWVAYLTPLANIPGPWHGRFTSFWVNIQGLGGHRCHWQQRMHKVYGPVVRIGPNLIAVCDSEAMKVIHNTTAPYHKLHQGEPVQNIFSMDDVQMHSFRRRLYQKLLTPSSLRNAYEPGVTKLIRQAMEGMKDEVRSKGSTDILKWWLLMANDTVALLTFGHGKGLMENGGSAKDVIMTNDIHKMIYTLRLSIPLFLILRFLVAPFSRRIAQIYRHDSKLKAYGQKSMRQTRQDEQLSTGGTFFARALREAGNDKVLVANQKTHLRDIDLTMDGVGFQLAGADTVGITLTFLVWCVLERPDLQQLLEAEVAGLVEVNDSSCEKLPLLNATIDETLRLWGGAPTALERWVPSGGTTFAGYFIPARSVVTTQAWSLHRDPSIWPDPERFEPKRWLGSESNARRSQDAFMPFGGGSRVCGGVNLARMELRLGAAMFFRECRGASLSPWTTHESMSTVLDRFNICPVGHRCDIVIPT